jgi:MoaA/NifB/PqqE/SkfB family radical SAM enzyme
MPAFTSIKAKAIGIAVDQGVNMLYDDFDGNLPKVESLINKFAGSGDSINDAQLRLFNMVMGYMKDPTNNWRRLVDNIINNVDKDVVKTFVHNFFVNSVTIGGARQREVNDTEGCNCPWAILMDPTTACNLHCNGCWAANYTDSKQKSLTFDELDSIITQGVELGTYIYLFTGGEPTLRKKDLIRLCEKHPDCYFSAFTNGTLVDEEFADEILRVKNFMPAFSIEGNREATDSRRGAGTYDKVVHAMDLLRERRLPFGASICYTSQNYDSVTSDEYVQFLVDKGVLFAWIFTYMPVGLGRSRGASRHRRAACRHVRQGAQELAQQRAHLLRGLLERRRVHGRLHRRRPPLHAHQRRRRRGALRVHPLLGLQHPREEPA